MNSIGRKPRRFLFRGELRTVREIEAITGLHNVTIYRRISGNRVLEGAELSNPACPVEPRKNARMIFYAGKNLCCADWAREVGLPVTTLHSRLERGWTISQALTVPVATKSKGRNRSVLRDITRRFRSYRNRQLIHRITTTFRPIEGGCSQISAYGRGTGAGRHAHDLQREICQ